MIETPVWTLIALRLDRIRESYLLSLTAMIRLARIRAQGIPLNFVAQSCYDFEIAGDLRRFMFDGTSHIKSGTFNE